MYESILLAIDGSDHSLRAAKEAARLAAAGSETQVTILYVADHNESSKETLHGASSVELDLSRRKKILPAEQTLQAKKVYYNVEILHGRPGSAIVEYVNDNRFDLVILGSRGLNPLQEMMLGSVSQKVLNHADCPVLLVK